MGADVADVAEWLQFFTFAHANQLVELIVTIDPLIDRLREIHCRYVFFLAKGWPDVLVFSETLL